MLKQSSPILPSLSESPSVVVCPRFALGRLTSGEGGTGCESEASSDESEVEILELEGEELLQSLG